MASPTTSSTVPQVKDGGASTPGTSAVVTFDDRFLARTPCYVILPAGRQRITLTYAGQVAPTPIEVNVSPRGLVKVRATLER